MDEVVGFPLGGVLLGWGRDMGWLFLCGLGSVVGVGFGGEC